MEALIVIAFIVAIVAMMKGYDNPTAPQSPLRKTFEQLHTEDAERYGDPFIPMIDTSPQMKHEYLKTPQWNTLRKTALKLANYSCQQCHCTDRPLEVHHTTYERVGNEKQSDLVAVCRTCHQAIHNKYGYSYYSQFPLLKDHR